ncbi:hypothetical protein PR003_g24348 [Phytophthora rubi]|uniref:Uncharacterized protein n=2 Tax=Phytophthora TaxID=4783 RepID=A0A6A4CPK2_9STRA|nr:hypothetical protein PR003_g24348 [Phytophthora rubi]
MPYSSPYSPTRGTTKFTASSESSPTSPRSPISRNDCAYSTSRSPRICRLSLSKSTTSGPARTPSPWRTNPVPRRRGSTRPRFSCHVTPSDTAGRLTAARTVLSHIVTGMVSSNPLNFFSLPAPDPVRSLPSRSHVVDEEVVVVDASFQRHRRYHFPPPPSSPVVSAFAFASGLDCWLPPSPRPPPSPPEPSP